AAWSSPYLLLSAWPSAHLGPFKSERNVVAALLGRLVVGFWRGAGSADASCRGSSRLLAVSVAAASVEKLNVLDDNLVLRPFLSGRLVVPSVVPKLPFQVDLRALLQVVRDHIHQSSEVISSDRFAIDVQRIRVVFPLSSLLVLATPADGEAELDDSVPSVREGSRRLRIVRQSADQHHFVQRGHSGRSWWVTGKSPIEGDRVLSLLKIVHMPFRSRQCQ